MPLHPQTRALLDALDDMGVTPTEQQDPVTARADRAALAPPVTEPCHATRDVDAGGVPARLYVPEPASAAPGLLIWLHGGGWVIGDLESHDNICHSLARRSGQAVLSVAYRLAPEDPFPAGLGDCVQAVRWAHAHADDLGVDADRIGLGGDSAGANLAAVVAHLAPVPLRLQVLVYPVTDARAGTPSYAENADGYFLTAAGMHWFIGHYLSGGEGAVDDPRVSPLLASDEAVGQSPPTLVVTAGYDPLRDEGVAYAERLAARGVTTTHVHFPGQVHAFFSLPHLLSDARLAHALVGEAITDALGAAQSTPR